MFSYAGWGIGLASLLIAVYAEFIKKDGPKLEYDIVSSTKFINNNETSANLKIFVDSLDVQKNHLNVSAYSIKVENKGSAHLRYDDYDKGTFGLKIQNAQLLEAPVLIESSTEHIRTLFPKRDSLINNTFVEIPDLSLDVDDYYILRLVLLHDDNSEPDFKPEGKIVGQKNIVFNQFHSPSPNFWTIVVSGNWLVHIVRFFLYFFIIVIVILIIAFTASQIDDVVSKRKRRKLIKELAQKKRIEEFVANDYVNNGELVIKRMNDVFSKNVIELSTKYKKSKGFVNSKRALEKNNHRDSRFHRDRYNTIQRMIEKGYLVLGDDDTLTFNQSAKQSINAIYSMLVSKDLLNKEMPMIYYGGGKDISIRENMLVEDYI